jgi:hypothetical protein
METQYAKGINLNLELKWDTTIGPRLPEWVPERHHGHRDETNNC